MKFLYNAGIYLFIISAYLLSPFIKRARQWRDGTRDWTGRISGKLQGRGKRIWVHCASLGEFEQGRPLIEAIKKKDPDSVIILTFFSPSGYEIRKNYGVADAVCYLPPDTPGNTRKFIDLVKPDMAVFIKYEFWYNYIRQLKLSGIALYLVSGIFRSDQHFFRWYGGFFRNILKGFTWFFVQDKGSADLLKEAGFGNVTVAGDTRFDRVLELAANAKDIRELEVFCKGEKMLLAGSSWSGDEEILSRYINANPGLYKWVFAPHEISEANIRRLEGLLRVKSVRFSRLTEQDTEARVLIIDNIGMLSSAYRYASVAVVGGGFGKGIHNILEPACWGIPVLFGPNHVKFREAYGMIEAGAAWSFSCYEEFKILLESLSGNQDLYEKSARSAASYVADNAGATGIVMSGIFS